MKQSRVSGSAVALAFVLWGQTGVARMRESFDHGWRFARFGLQADGSRVPEPGGNQWSVELSASSEETGAGRDHPALLAMDGDRTTRWCASDNAPAQWLTLAFDVPRALRSAVIDWDVSPAWKEKQLPYGFVVEGSADGVDWTTLADRTKPADGFSVVVALDGTYRFLRVRTVSVAGSQWASIREIGLIDGDGKPIVREARQTGDSPETSAFDDAGWRALDIPHDWGIEGPFRLELAGETGKLPWKGIGWYRKTFDLPAADRGKCVFVDFDGAMAYAKIWCNGRYVGTWPYGYSSFRMDLTPYLVFGGANVLAVRLDTEKWDSRWYPGAGIYRHVWLVKTEPVHVGHWGTFVTTPEVSDEAATVKMAVTVDNRSGEKVQAEVATDLYELDGQGGANEKPVASMTAATIEIAPGGSAVLSQTAVVAHPKRWDIVSPNRYLARTRVSLAGREVDRYDTPFGIRTLAFTARDGFQLNGRRVFIKGTCNHHDLGALGAALNDRALERQLDLLKEMGCNALRTSHNPPAPELLELADRMGFLVWDEAFDCWKRGKKANDYNKIFDDWHLRDLQALVRRDRNHPSVIIWSIGNEVIEQRNVALTRHLADVMRAEDPTRPISNGYNDPDGGRGSGAVEGIDIMGVNYFFGKQDQWDVDPRYKGKPTIGSETSSCVSSRGEYFFGSNRANWQVSSYDRDRPGWGCDPDTQFRNHVRWPHLLGEFVWTGFDYLGEPTPFGSKDDTQLLNFRNDPARRAQLEKELAELAKVRPPSRSSYFGIIDLAGFPKDRFYSYQAHWRPDLPMAHLFPHWNWPERVGLITPVHLYTSGDEAELFLDGTSLGRRKKKVGEDFRLVWDDVVYAPGTLKAVVYRDGKHWATDTVKTAGAAAALALAPDRAAIRADGRDLAFVTVRVADQDGITVPRAGNTVDFSVEGPGEIVAVDNGDATSFEPFQGNRRRAYNGLALVIVRAKAGLSGTITLRATSEGLSPATLVLTAR